MTGLALPTIEPNAGQVVNRGEATGAGLIGPAIGGFLLQTSPNAVWWGGALAVVLGGAVLLRLGGRIPDPLREAQSRLASAAEPA